MTLTRYLLLTVAIFAGTYAAVSWITAQPTDAGVAGAISAAAVLAAEGIAYCQRGRMRAGREQVWERRERYTTDDWREAVDQLWAERRPITKLITYDKHGEPVSGYDSDGHSGISLIDTQAAVWDFGNGSPE